MNTVGLQHLMLVGSNGCGKVRVIERWPAVTGVAEPLHCLDTTCRHWTRISTVADAIVASEH